MRTVSERPDTEATKRSRAATRRKIVEQAAPVFVNKGLEAASVADLCAAAGFTRGAFYSNFASKTELAIAVYAYRVDQLVEVLRTEVGRQIQRQVPVAQMLTFVLQALSGLSQEAQWQGFRLDMHLAADRDDELRHAVDQQYQRIVDAVAEVLMQVTVRGVRYRIEHTDLARILIAVWDGELLRAGHRMSSQAGMGARLITATWEAFVIVE